MSICAECQENLSLPRPVLPEAFRRQVSEAENAEVIRQVHERAERDGISHTEAGARLFVEAFPAARLP